MIGAGLLVLNAIQALNYFGVINYSQEVYHMALTLMVCLFLLGSIQIWLAMVVGEENARHRLITGP